MRFEWDSAKAAANVRKHGLDFRAAMPVFADPARYERLDDRAAYGEQRWVTVGAVDARILTVVYTVREDSKGEIIRIISARKADAKEEKSYRLGYI